MYPFFYYINNTSFTAAALTVLMATFAAYVFFGRLQALMLASLVLGSVCLALKARTGVFIAHVFLMTTITIYLGAQRPKLTTWFVCISVTLTLLMLCFFFKSDSTSGRLFILRNTLTIIANNPDGIGFGQFGRVYNLQQAAYFKTHSLTDQAALHADNVQFAFNDFLQFIAELGWFLGAFIIFLNFWVCHWSVVFFRKHPSRLLFAAIIGLICMQAFSLLYYPAKNLFCFSFYLLCMGFIMKKMQFHSRVMDYFLAAHLVIFPAMCIAGTIAQIKNEDLLGQAVQLSRVGYIKESRLAFAGIEGYYKDHPQYQVSYGEHLLLNNKPDSALYYFEKAADQVTTSELYGLIGDAYMDKKLYEKAEKYYLDAVYMVPSRFISRKKLADCYRMWEKTEFEKKWLLTIVKMPVKKPGYIISAIQYYAASRYAELCQRPQ